MEIKQFGLHRSGTNFLRVILQENYHIRVHSNVGGWKHGPYEVPRRLGRELDCAVCVKDPYAWLASVHRYRHPGNDVNFPNFVKGPIEVASREDPTQAIRKCNPVRLWVEMNEHWLNIELVSHHLFVFQYERMLREPEKSLEGLARELGLRRRVSIRTRVRRMLGRIEPPPFYVPPRQLGALRDHYRKKNLQSGESFDPAYYSRQGYLALFDPELIAFVNSQLDHALISRLGYALLATDAVPASSEAANP